MLHIANKKLIIGNRRASALDNKKKRTGPSLEDKKVVGQRLRDSRISQGLRAVDVLEILRKDYDIEMSKSTYTCYEKGLRMPDPGLLGIFAKCFKTNTDFLIGSIQDSSPAIEKQTLSKLIQEGKVFFEDYQIPPEVWQEFCEQFSDILEDKNKK